MRAALPINHFFWLAFLGFWGKLTMRQFSTRLSKQFTFLTLLLALTSGCGTNTSSASKSERKALTALREGTMKTWRDLSPEEHLAICRVAAKKLHPGTSEEFISERTLNYRKFLNDFAFGQYSLSESKLTFMIASCELSNEAGKPQSRYPLDYMLQQLDGDEP